MNRIFIIFTVVFLFFACSQKEVKRQMFSIKENISDLQTFSAEYSDNMEKIFDEIQQLKGKIEKIEHNQNINTEAVKELQDSLAFNVESIKNEFSESINKIETMIKNANKTATVPDNIKKLNIDSRYKNARKFHLDKKYDQAEPYYQSIIGSKSRWYDERVRFYLGIMYFDMARYKESVIVLQELADKYPDSKFISSALLVQGKSFEFLGKKKEAKVFYSDLVSRFPNSASAKEAATRLKKL